jgi:hypothetical protein
MSPLFDAGLVPMAKYDDILESQLSEIRDIAERVIALEREGPSGDNRGPGYVGLRFALEQRYETVLNVLRALLFDDVSETGEEYEERRKAYVEYKSRALLREPEKATSPASEIDADGPLHSFLEYRDRHDAAEARVAKVHES